ncbi:hypothetical protein DFH09DRAFT_1342577 [Mycena vulgaris]|nr:hypothetical protein DFH09DRAFT_1342577 [Mycena vulgaris]
MVKKTDADEPPARKRTPTQKAKAAPKKKGKGKKKIDVSSDDSEIEDGGPPVPFKHIDIEAPATGHLSLGQVGGHELQVA